MRNQKPTPMEASQQLDGHVMTSVIYSHPDYGTVTMRAEISPNIPYAGEVEFLCKPIGCPPGRETWHKFCHEALERLDNPRLWDERWG